MRVTGLVELLRRAAALALFVIAATQGFADLRAPHWGAAAGWALAALAVYILVPRPAVPAGALRFETMPAIVMPDMLGFLLGTTFFALPLVVMASEEALREGLWILVAVMWLLGSAALAIHVIAARNAVSWIVLRDDGFTVATLWAVSDFAFADIARVVPVARRLPRWVGTALFLFGGIRGAGVALLHADRVAHAIDIVGKDGTRLRFAADALGGLPRLLGALHRAGVPLEGRLAAAGAKAARRR